MIKNLWVLGENDTKELYRILRKAGILQSTVAGKIVGAELCIHTTYLHLENKGKQS